jgi:DNA-binding NtrC family response regulator
MANDLHTLMTQEQASVVFLDDSEDLRALMPLVLEPALGVKCMCFGSLMELEERRDDVLRAKLAILDINLGPNVPDGIDAFNWLVAHGFHGKILFFTGHTRTVQQVEAAQGKGFEILQKPVQPGELISHIRRALNGNP